MIGCSASFSPGHSSGSEAGILNNSAPYRSGEQPSYGILPSIVTKPRSGARFRVRQGKLRYPVSRNYPAHTSYDELETPKVLKIVAENHYKRVSQPKKIDKEECVSEESFTEIIEEEKRELEEDIPEELEPGEQMHVASLASSYTTLISSIDRFAKTPLDTRSP